MPKYWGVERLVGSVRFLRDIRFSNKGFAINYAFRAVLVLLRGFLQFLFLANVRLNRLAFLGLISCHYTKYIGSMDEVVYLISLAQGSKQLALFLRDKPFLVNWQTKKCC